MLRCLPVSNLRALAAFVLVEVSMHQQPPFSIAWKNLFRFIQAALQAE
jgi:hypothetical protein